MKRRMEGRVPGSIVQLAPVVAFASTAQLAIVPILVQPEVTRPASAALAGDQPHAELPVARLDLCSIKSLNRSPKSRVAEMAVPAHRDICRS